MIEVYGVRRHHGRRHNVVHALAEVTFVVPDREFVCVLGPSGCGKTTLLRCMAGLLQPSAGQVLFDGHPVTSTPLGMSVVFQEYARSLFPWKSVRANVELPLRTARVPRSRRRAMVDEALESVGLADRADAYPWQLSGGMQQRVAIARAVVSGPRALIMDEPFAAVDAQTREELEDLVRRLWRERGMTVVFVTHDIDEAIYLGERVLVLGRPPVALRADVAVDLGPHREQVATRGLPRFSEYRAHLHEQVRLARETDTEPVA